MAQNYKIFVNDTEILFTNTSHLINNSTILLKEDSISNLVFQIYNSEIGKNLYYAFITDDYKRLFKKFIKQFKVIEAAGGIVYNEKQQILIIKRLGKWDLPKGKIEKGEEVRLAALREVHEECGVEFLSILKKYGYTHHLYLLKGRWVLKRTTWYYMSSHGEQQPKPQLEEDITEALWVDKSFVKSNDFETYPSLKAIFMSV